MQQYSCLHNCKVGDLITFHTSSEGALCGWYTPYKETSEVIDMVFTDAEGSIPAGLYPVITRPPVYQHITLRYTHIAKIKKKNK